MRNPGWSNENEPAPAAIEAETGRHLRRESANEQQEQ